MQGIGFGVCMGVVCAVLLPLVFNAAAGDPTMSHASGTIIDDVRDKAGVRMVPRLPDVGVEPPLTDTCLGRLDQAGPVRSPPAAVRDRIRPVRPGCGPRWAAGERSPDARRPEDTRVRAGVSLCAQQRARRPARQQGQHQGSVALERADQPGLGGRGKVPVLSSSTPTASTTRASWSLRATSRARSTPTARPWPASSTTWCARQPRRPSRANAPSQAAPLSPAGGACASITRQRNQPRKPPDLGGCLIAAHGW
jgi:hypothetical protein